MNLSAIIVNIKLMYPMCIGFIDKREEEFNSILMFWKVQGLYDREKINKLLDDFEQSYDRLFNQE